jgi:hypothetical protein
MKSFFLMLIWLCGWRAALAQLPPMPTAPKAMVLTAALPAYDDMVAITLNWKPSPEKGASNVVRWGSVKTALTNVVVTLASNLVVTVPEGRTNYWTVTAKVGNAESAPMAYESLVGFEIEGYVPSRGVRTRGKLGATNHIESAKTPDFAIATKRKTFVGNGSLQSYEFSATNAAEFFRVRAL